MKVLEIFKLKEHGTVVVFDCDIFDVKVGNVIKRFSDNQEWTIKGLEKWSYRDTTDTVLIANEPAIFLGDELTLIKNNEK